VTDSGNGVDDEQNVHDTRSLGFSSMERGMVQGNEDAGDATGGVPVDGHVIVTGPVVLGMASVQHRVDIYIETRG
jgi:hypothetical protein